MAGMNSLVFQNDGTTDTNAAPSPAVWGPMQQLLEDILAHPEEGTHFDFFARNPLIPIYASTVSQAGIKTYQDTGVLFNGDPAAPGTLLWDQADADNDCGIITGDGGVGTSFVISSADQRNLAFEIGLKKSAITDNSTSFFVGLTEEALVSATTSVLGTDSGALVDKDLIGFHVTQAAGSTVTFVYNKAGAGGVTVKIASLATMVAATWIKLGFRVDWGAPAANRIKIFLNNVEQSTYVTHANAIAATFPDAQNLTPTIAFKKGEATLATAAVRLWKVAQKAA